MVLNVAFFGLLAMNKKLGTNILKEIEIVLVYNQNVWHCDIVLSEIHHGKFVRFVYGTFGNVRFRGQRHQLYLQLESLLQSSIAC